MIIILDNVLNIIGIISIVISVVGSSVGIWALVTHREKKYIEQRTIFEEQLKRVQNDLRGGTNNE